MNFARLTIVATALSLPLPAWSYSGNDIYQWADGFDKKNAGFVGGLYLGYVTGVVDSFQLQGYCPPEQLTNGQTGSIVLKWLEDNPERWTENGSTLVLEALQKAFPCKK